MKPATPATSHRARAFSLVELLVVMAIIGLLATFGIPALRGFGQSNSLNAAVRQLTDDLGLARLYAITERTDVYVVFMPPLTPSTFSGYNEDEKLQLTNLVSGQYTAYNFYTTRSIGDQPGSGSPRYITDWKYLPEGVFIDTNKFVDLTKLGISIDTVPATNRPFHFKRDKKDQFNFPLAISTNKYSLPYIGFNYQGQLLHRDDEFIRLTKGSLINERGPDGKTFRLVAPEVVETAKGNTTNNPYIRIDWLSGRARVMVNTPGT